MKKSYKKLIIFDIIIVLFLILNSFILNILGNYWYMSIFLLTLLISFKYIFGFEKDNHRYIKDIMQNILIIYLLSFIFYYIFGLLIGYVRTDNYFTLYGITAFLLPYVIMISLKEYFRFQVLNKTDQSKALTIVTCILFILIDCANQLSNSSLSSNYNIFLFIALSILPIISNNIVCTYISRKVGYKPNIAWLLVAGLYGVVLPIVPNVGLYIESLIMFLFPYIIMSNVHSFFEKRAQHIPISYNKKKIYIELPALAIMVFTLAYFISGLFRYYAIAVASGSMRKYLEVGDVVIVDQKIDYRDLEIGEIIAYRYNNIIIIHRLYDKVVVGNDYFFYTKGDANVDVDKYIIYPDTIVGKVKFKLTGIGLPTIWLNQLFE